MLLTIDHADLAEPIRVVNNTEDVTVGADTYIAFPFEIELPGEAEDQLPKARLRIDNVDRQIVDAVRTVSGTPDVTLEIVLASDPTVTEMGPFEMQLRSADYDALVVSGDLVVEDVLNIRYPGDRFTPASHPGLFR